MRKRTSLIVTLLVLFAAVVFAAGYAVAAMQPHPQHEASWNELVSRGLIEGDADYYSMGFATEQEYYHALATAILAVDDKAGSSFRPIVPLPTSTTTTLPPTTAPSPTSTVAPSSTTTSSSTTTTTLTPTTTTTSTPGSTTSTTGPPTTSSTTTSTTTLPPVDATVAEGELLSKINASRSAEGLPPLGAHQDLVSYAREHSAAMMAAGRIYHSDNLGDAFTGWEALAENVGAGPSVDSLHIAFMDSAGHRANILGNYDHAGVGVVVDSEGVLWVTVVFMRTIAPATTTTTSTTTTLPPPTTTTTTTTAPPPPTGPVVTIVAGVHQDWSVEVMENTSYLCEDGAILDGGGTVKYAFYGDADNVTIDGCEIRNYDNPAQHGAINAGKQTDTGADNWTITNNEIHHNWGVGIYVSGDNYLVRGNNIHHQHQLGVALDEGAGLFENNEIAWNNYEVDYSWGWEAGGTKFWETNGLVVRGNWSHDNHGPGLWDDYNNINILYEGNLVEDNYGPGIFHEIGYDAIIRNNTIRRNGFGHAAWLWGAGVVVAASQDTEVYGNTVEGNYNGITLVNQERNPGANYDNLLGDWVTINNSVHDNTVTNSGLSGGATDNNFETMFDPGVNVFENNTYTNGAWAWDHTTRSWSEWLGYHPNDGP